MAKRVNKSDSGKNDEGTTKRLKNLENGKKFTKDNQPTPEAKKAGWAKKRSLQDLAEALITGDALEKAMSTALKVGMNLSKEEYTLEIVMTLRQIEKAIAKGDTRAYSAAMDRLRGKARQSIELSGNVKSSKDLSKMSMDQLLELEKELENKLKSD